MSAPVILGAARSPLGAVHGALGELHPADVLAVVLSGLVERAGLDPADVAEVVCGCAEPVGGQGGRRRARRDPRGRVGRHGRRADHRAGGDVGSRRAGRRPGAGRVGRGAVGDRRGDRHAERGSRGCGRDGSPPVREAVGHAARATRSGTTGHRGRAPRRRSRQAGRLVRGQHRARPCREPRGAASRARSSPWVDARPTRCPRVSHRSTVRRSPSCHPSSTRTGRSRRGTAPCPADGAVAIAVADPDWAARHGAPVLAHARGRDARLGRAGRPRRRRGVDAAVAQPTAAPAPTDAVELPESTAALAVTLQQALAIDPAIVNRWRRRAGARRAVGGFGPACRGHAPAPARA